MSELSQGLQLSVWGIMITFASLGVLILVMVALREMFSEKPSVGPEPDDVEDDLSAYWEDLRIRAVGIAVSIAHLQRSEKLAANLGALLESPSAKRGVQRSQNE